MNGDQASEMHVARDKMCLDSRKQMDAIVTLAGFTVAHVWELANGYWPRHPHYDDVRAPWWLFMTEIGPIQIGRRKNVIHIEWGATTVRAVVTADDVTKTTTYVHAWSVEKAVEYLRALRASSQQTPGGGDGG